MKIATISSARVPSDRANSIQVMKVCQALMQLGHEVTLIVPAEARAEEITQPALMKHYGLSQSVPVEWLPAASRRLFPWQAIRRAQKLGASIVYTRLLPAAVLGLVKGLPVILEIHEPPGGRFGPTWYRLFVRLPGRKVLLLLSGALRTLLRQRYAASLTVEQMGIAGSGVDLERYLSLPGLEAARASLGMPNRKTVACTGHLYPGRGADLFVRLARQMPEVQFLWVGGRPEDVADWRERVKDISNVDFRGFIPNQEMPLYQAAADILLMPYQSSVAGSSGGDIAGVFSP